MGLEIVRAAARHARTASAHVKRVVAEMGGKNCVIVDADADLDEAVPEIVHSAFGYAGQKCSAAARVLVHEAIADTLVERLAGAVEVLRVGQAEEFATEVPPVIEREAQERVLRYARARRATHGRGRAEPRARRRAGSARPRSPSGLPEDSPVQPRGDVRAAALASTPVRDVDARLRRGRLAAVRAHRRPLLAQPRRRWSAWRAACRWATSTSTAGSPARWSAASRSAATGAPGVGAKAGGPDYLLQFVEPRVVTENTMRHGIPVE